MSGNLSRLHRDVREIFSSAVDAVDPYRIVRQTLTVDRDTTRQMRTLSVAVPSDNGETEAATLLFTFAATGLSSSSSVEYTRLVVIAVGKCAFPMSVAADEIFGADIADGICLTKHGHLPRDAPRLRRIRVATGGHPIPDNAGEEAAKRIAALLDENRSASTLILLLLSGGSSALMTCPPVQSDILLADIQSTSRILQSCGADITELNTIRKHISGISGGRFAARAQPSTVLTLVLSDVVGSPLTVIGSGPTVIDTSTFSDCQEIIKRYDIGQRLPTTIVHHIQRGLNDSSLETPKSLPIGTVHNVIVGSNLRALNAALRHSQSLGYHSIILTDRLSGDVGGVSRIMSAIASTCHCTRRYPIALPAAILAGGEPTVTVLHRSASALGGRSQHGALLTAKLIAGQRDVVVLAGGTDGDDGPTDAAGAVVDGTTISRAQQKRLDADDYIERFDSYHFFKRLDDRDRDGGHDDRRVLYHLVTGPTGTNVMDLWIALIADNVDTQDVGHRGTARSSL